MLEINYLTKSKYIQPEINHQKYLLLFQEKKKRATIRKPPIFMQGSHHK